MTCVCRWIPAVLATAVLCSPSEARARSGSNQSSPSPSASARCVALPLPTLRGADGSSTELAGGLRDLVSSFLTGPSLRTVALDARLAEQAQEEARQKNCGTVLTITLTRKKSGGGAFGKMLGDAAGAAAWHMPYGSSAGSTAARSAAIAGASATSSMASNTRAKDELHLEYRLSSDGLAAAIRDGKDSAKAKADGEDLMTPLVERMATIVAGAVTK
jgi:hypothetical protein